MKKNIIPCLEQHLPEKAKPGNVVPPEAWFEAAAAHLASARAITDADPSGAFMLGWESMHKTAKGVAGVGGARLETSRCSKIRDSTGGRQEDPAASEGVTCSGLPTHGLLIHNTLRHDESRKPRSDGTRWTQQHQPTPLQREFRSPLAHPK